MGSSIIGKDENKHQVGRYLQFLLDANLKTTKQLEVELRQNVETLSIHTHRMKDFMHEALAYKRAASILENPGLKNESERNKEFLLALRDFKSAVDSKEATKAGLGHEKSLI